MLGRSVVGDAYIGGERLLQVLEGFAARRMFEANPGLIRGRIAAGPWSVPRLRGRGEQG
jgi:hypothetical protein